MLKTSALENKLNRTKLICFGSGQAAGRKAHSRSDQTGFARVQTACCVQGHEQPMQNKNKNNYYYYNFFKKFYTIFSVITEQPKYTLKLTAND